jgi:hypothetical protein
MWQRSFPVASMFVESEGMLTWKTSILTGWTAIGLQIMNPSSFRLLTALEPAKPPNKSTSQVANMHYHFSD